MYFHKYAWFFVYLQTFCAISQKIHACVYLQRVQNIHKQFQEEKSGAKNKKFTINN